MPDIPPASFHLDPPGPVAAGLVTLTGWAVGSGGNFIADLRVRLAGKIHPVVFGLQRPDLARHFNAREPFLLAGFEVRLPLVAGENRPEFEQCVLDGRWLPLAAPAVTADAAALTLVPVGPASVEAPEFARALRLVLQRNAAEPPGESLDESADAVVRLLPQPFITRFAVLPFHGHLHQPTMLQRADFGRLIVEGWLFHETEKIRRVAATVDLQAWSYLEIGGHVPYVADLFPQFSHANTCRIEGYIDVPAQLPSPLSVRIYAELADGAWHLCHVQRNHVYDGEANKASYGRFRPGHFVRATFALRVACRRHGFGLPTGQWFLRALREVWTEYSARAERHRWVTPPTPVIRPLPPPSRVVLATHNLNFEGAPLFLVEYAEHLATAGCSLTIISGTDGPLRARCEAANARVLIVDVSALRKCPGEHALAVALRTLATQVDLSAVDLVVANTLSTFWAVHLAHAAGKRSLFYIHESTTPDAFYLGQMAPGTLPLVKKTFRLASHVSFLTQATRRYFQANLVRPNHSLNPGWIDVARLDRFRATHPRENLRVALGLAPEIRLVVNLGTICDRKGQHIFARAVDLLWRREPALAAGSLFLMVGGRDTPFDRSLADLLGCLNRSNLRAVPETATPADYYGAADLFVCSSYEESFPRVILEAMAFHLPIVSAGVHGVPEMARAGREALLVPPGDPAALASAIIGLLAEPSRAVTFGEQAAIRVAAEYDSRVLLPRHAALAGAVAAGII